MPALPNVPAVLKFHLGFAWGVDTTTGFHLFVSTGGATTTVSQLQAVATATSTAWGTSCAARVHPQVTLTSVKITDLSSSTAAEAEISATVPGTAVGGMLPASTCCLINAHIARRYRGGKPRFYVPFGTDADLGDPQHWNISSVNAFNTAWTSWTNAVKAAVNGNIGGASATIVNVSYYAGNEWFQDAAGNWHEVQTIRSPPLVDAITSMVARELLGTQRRRISG